MTPSDELDDWLERQPPMTPEEQQEILLGYFTGVLDAMRVDDVVALRAHLLQRFPTGPEQDTMIEVLDGHVAVRRLAE